jgi:MraZ protein
MFRGTFWYTIDDKGRVSVPARFRDLIVADTDDRVVITNFKTDSVSHLDVYRYVDWVRLEERLRQFPHQFDPTFVRFKNYYVARAHECPVDKQGRILLPPTLREYAQLDRDVVITGAEEKFNIWNQTGWEKVFATAEEELFKDPNQFKELGL